MTAFIDRAEMARLTARMLLEIKAVNFEVENPYKLASGLVSPSYIDCRELISYPSLHPLDPDRLHGGDSATRCRFRGL